jgi:hypothetical protein
MIFNNRSFLKFISNSNFLQFLASKFSMLIPVIVDHNLGKYNLIRKIAYLISIDEIDGDYAEFGCFTGSCLKHANRCFKYFKLDKNIFGFDSFEGFPKELHKEFINENFISDYDKVKNLEKKYPKIKITKGFFSESLKTEKVIKDLDKISFSFIDCDIAISSKDVFEFIIKKQTNGSFIMIDDFYNLDKEGNSIREEFFKYFTLNKNVFVCNYFGLGGVCFRYFKT